MRTRRLALRPAHGASLAVLALRWLRPAPAQAGLFDDDEARKAILDLRERIDASDEQPRRAPPSSGQANAQLIEQLQPLRRSLLDLNNQLETMRAEIAKLRGSDEQLTRDLAELQRGRRTWARRSTTGCASWSRRRCRWTAASSSSNPTRSGLRRSHRRHPRRRIRQGGGGAGRLPAPLPGQRLQRFGALLAGQRAVRQARLQGGDRRLPQPSSTGAPDHPRAPEALLALANSQAEMKDVRGARKTIDELIKAYPKSEAAQAGKERLASLK